VTDACPRCAKPVSACICDRIEPAATKLRVVILQHPQEDDELLGTAKLITLTLPRAELRVGLSWRSLGAAIGVDAAEPSRWAVLAATKLPAGARPTTPANPVMLYERSGKTRELKSHRLDGFIVLDGTWKQAKTLWWRNPWLLKLPRLALTPREASLYGKLRREPRREYVSTLEAVADVLAALGESEAVRASLRRALRTLLQRVRDMEKPGA
jgi:DTW domain-containing protein YfiP